MKLCLVTGATGCVGGHVTERLLAEGHRVRTVVRPSSDTRLLDQWRVEKITGDLTDRDALKRAAAGVNIVVHTAAKVGDWGPVDEYLRVNVGGLRDLFDALAGQPLERFVHVSSLGV